MQVSQTLLKAPIDPCWPQHSSNQLILVHRYHRELDKSHCKYHNYHDGSEVRNLAYKVMQISNLSRFRVKMTILFVITAYY